MDPLEACRGIHFCDPDLEEKEEEEAEDEKFFKVPVTNKGINIICIEIINMKLAQ